MEVCPSRSTGWGQKVLACHGLPSADLGKYESYRRFARKGQRRTQTSSDDHLDRILRLWGQTNSESAWPKAPHAWGAFGHASDGVVLAAPPNNHFWQGERTTLISD